MTDTPALTEPGDTPATPAAASDRAAARKTWLTRLAIALVLIGLAAIAWYYIFDANYVSTDDAYIDGESAQVTPLTSASVVALHVSDTQYVTAGTVLAELDDSDARIAVAQAGADLAEAQRKFRQTRATGASLEAAVNARGADIAGARAQLDTARVTEQTARLDLDRRLSLAGSGAVSGEDVSNARKAYAAAKSGVSGALAALAQAQSTRASASGQAEANSALTAGLSEATDPGVVAARARLDAARLELGRMTIRAPISGVVSQRRVQLGQRVAQGVPIMAVVPTGQLFVSANFKERQLDRVKPGMPATVTADIYGGITFHGHVVGIAGETGAAASIIPAQNATGNWIKVVQRLPVRIALDPRDLAAHPLRVGLSAEATIDLNGH